jgi:hypothetical protein
LRPRLEPSASSPPADTLCLSGALKLPKRFASLARAARLTLPAALCWARTAEITNALVDLLIELVHGIGTRAEN